jgi:hypothetical protein
MKLHDLRPDIADVFGFPEAEKGFRRMVDGDLIGKVVFTW